MSRMLGDPGQDVGQPGLRIDIVQFGSDNQAVTIRLYITAARWPPRSEPANNYNHDFLPRAIPRSARSAALFERQIRPSSRKRVKAGQRLSIVIDCLGQIVAARELGPLPA